MQKGWHGCLLIDILRMPMHMVRVIPNPATRSRISACDKVVVSGPVPETWREAASRRPASIHVNFVSTITQFA